MAAGQGQARTPFAPDFVRKYRAKKAVYPLWRQIAAVGLKLWEGFPKGEIPSFTTKEDFIVHKGKRYVDSAKTIDRTRLYEPNEALSTVIATAKAKFDETIELHVKLGVDSRHADQQVRGAIVLPHGTGRTVRVAVFAKGPKADEARAAGADVVGAEDLMERIQKENFFEFDVVIATPDMMGVVGRLGRVLGPKGLMPNPKAGTVSMDVARAVQESKAGKIEYRLDKTNIIHCPIGKASFGTDKLTENFDALMGAIIKAKPAAAKGQYVRSCVVASTMGPGVKVNTARLMG